MIEPGPSVASAEPLLPRGASGVAAAILFALACLVVVLGWRAFWFLTDDAFISFRYISNSVMGLGYVWNAPPFQPVEGYTNFLWLVLLETVWRVAGYEPPAACNLIGLGFSLLSLGLTGLMTLSMPLEPALRRHRVAILGLVLLGTATNRTFLTWSSSGLETALFNALVLAWIYGVLFWRAAPRARLLGLSASAALVYLTRPDGVLLVGATVLLAALDFRARRKVREILFGIWPLALVPLHLGWRRALYGEWLPNSYYAKHAGLWTESGLRYALAFALEYALWVWLACALALGVLAVRRLRSDAPTSWHWERRAGAGLVLAVLAAHFGYYTLIIGGDHFEYRVYSHLVPLVFLSLLWMVNALRLRPGAALAAIAVSVLLSWPVPYTHWLATRSLSTREQTFKMRVPVADRWPAPVAWYARLFDRTQFWLIEHFVCVRHQEHKVNLAFVQSLFPSRERGQQIGSDGYPVMSFPAVGYGSWVLPHVSFLDTHGLNDRFVARNPIPPGASRAMAHDRQPPPGYLECFDPNVYLLERQQVRVTRRRRPLTASGIRACEDLWARRLGLQPRDDG